MLIIIAFILITISIFLLYINIFNHSIQLSPSQAKSYIKKGKINYIVDVRSLDEWEKGHYDTALHIPIDKIVQQLPEKIPQKSDSILFYCKKGLRASGAALIAKRLGYSNVYYLDGTYSNIL